MRANKIVFHCLLVLSGNWLLANWTLAQDSAFLDCARFSDRGQRIACLEDALEAAVDAGRVEMAESRPAEPPDAAAPAPTPAPAPVPAVAPASEEADPSLLDRLRNFGHREQASIEEDAEGNEELHDTIAALEQRRGLWIVTLSSGQIWRQQVPRRLNLREGDEIRIYQEGIGSGYRLAARHLSGFIRVERVE